jgi:hypothetical protein
MVREQDEAAVFLCPKLLNPDIVLFLLNFSKCYPSPDRTQAILPVPCFCAHTLWLASGYELSFKFTCAIPISLNSKALALPLGHTQSDLRAHHRNGDGLL